MRGEPAASPAAPGRLPGVHLGIVVVNFGSSHLVAENLAGIDRSCVPRSTVVVVDNWSSHAERRAITKLTERHAWELITTDANLGFGAGMNRGAAHALDRGCTHLLLLNPDVTIDADSLSRLVMFAVDHANTLVSPRLNRPDGSTWFAHGQLDRRTGLTRSQREPRGGDRDQWLSGACLLVDRATWESLGGFDERYFLYWEDIDLSQRVLDLGGDLRVLHAVSAIHSVGGTQTGGGRSARYCFYMCRNRLRFAGAHLPARDRIRWLRYAPTYTRRAVLEGRRSVFRNPARTVSALAGTIVGAGAVVRRGQARPTG
jgi:GT2 family glycosyltransferase